MWVRVSRRVIFYKPGFDQDLEGRFHQEDTSPESWGFLNYFCNLLGDGMYNINSKDMTQRYTRWGVACGNDSYNGPWDE